MTTASPIVEEVKGLKTMLTVTNEQELNKRIAHNENWLKTHRSSIYRREREQDESPIRQEIMRDKRTLQERTAHRNLSEKERDELNKRRKYLETQIKQGMPTKDEMMGERKSVDGNPNKKCQVAQPHIVKKNLEWMKRTGDYCREWKQIMRLLDPHNPTAANVENLRKIH